MFPIGIGGHICAYTHRIKLSIEKEEFECNVLFSDEFIVKFNLLGRVGLFDKFKVFFEDKEKNLSLQKKNNGFLRKIFRGFILFN